MTAQYPGTIVNTFITHQNVTEQIDASHVNRVQEEIVALETYIGANPHVSTTPSSSSTFQSTGSTFTNLVARLANIETGIVSDAHTQYLHLRGGDTITVSSASTVALAFQAAASQTADLVQGLDSSAVKRYWVDSAWVVHASGFAAGSTGLTVGGPATFTSSYHQQVNATAPNATTPPVIISGAASQTADLLQIKNSASANVFRIGPSGKATTQLNQSFFIAGAFAAGTRTARWIVPAACTLTTGMARLDGGSGGALQWGLYVNGVQAATGGTGNLSGTVSYNTGVQTYSMTSLSLNAGDSVQLYVTNLSGTCADFSVTLGGNWNAA